MEIKDIAMEVAKVLSDKKAFDISIIDIGEKSSFADYFVNATAGNARQISALADFAEDKLAEEGIFVKSKEGRPETGWILIDAGDIIVNIFSNDVRDRYSLDKLWSDCEIITVED